MVKNLFSIEGKIALVTGGSRGIGEMIAAGFLASGAKVYISSRKADACEATARRLVEEHGGECVSLPADVSRLDGIKTPLFDNFSYGPAKAAVHHLTRVLAAHLIKENIMVNGIAPGPFPTWMLSAGVGFGGEVEGQDWDLVGSRNPRGRVGTMEDIAGVAIFLSSRASGFTVGDIITCDGGAVAAS